MISNSGTTSLGLYDLKRQIDAFGGVDYFRPNLAGGYLKNARVMLANGDIVKSTIDGNANDPNVDRTGWANPFEGGVLADTFVTVTANGVGRVARNQADKNSDIIFDRDYGLKGDGTDETAALQAALNGRGTLNFSVGSVYLVSEPLLIGDELRAIMGNGAKFIFSKEQGSGENNSLFNALARKSSLTIRDIELEYTGTFDFGYSYTGKVCGIRVDAAQEFTGLVLENITASGFNNSGILIAQKGSYINRVVIKNCHLHHNRIAGTWFGNVNHIEISGNICEYNGHIDDIGTGYGMSGNSYGYPKNVYIHHNTCNNNYRKGIDTHAGYNVTIDSNVCENNRMYGIFSLNKNTRGQNNEIVPIRDSGHIKIINNTVTSPEVVYELGGMHFTAIEAGVSEKETADNSESSIHIKGNHVRIHELTGIETQLIVVDTSTYRKCAVEVSGNHLFSANNATYHLAFNDTITPADNYAGGEVTLNFTNNVININLMQGFLFRSRPASNLKHIIMDSNIFRFGSGITSMGFVFSFRSLINYPAEDKYTPQGKSYHFTNNIVQADGFSKFDMDMVYLDSLLYANVTNNTFQGIPYRNYARGVYTWYDANSPAISALHGANKLEWTKGSVVYNLVINPTQSVMGWRCTVAGSPGTWVAFGSFGA